MFWAGTWNKSEDTVSVDKCLLDETGQSAVLFRQRLEQLVHGGVAEFLIERGMELYAKLTAEELAAIGPPDGMRLVKVILCSLDHDKLFWREIGAESIKGEVRRMRRINSRRY
jgi:hypothetical protein